MNDPLICSIDGCGKAVKTRGWCNSHYLRVLKYGDPFGGPRGPRASDGEPLAWIMAHANYDGGGCLIWPFARFKRNGYACIVHNGKTTHATIPMCEQAHGLAPIGKLFVLHSCANGHGGCINPKHLRWGSQAENMADSVAQGTRSRGASNNASKLSEGDVQEIRNLMGTMPKKEIATRYGINPDHVRAIERGLVWAWLK